MRNGIYTKRIIGAAGLLLSLLIIFSYSPLVELLTDLGKTYFNRGESLEPLTVYKIKISILFVIILLVASSLLLTFNLITKIHLFFNHFFQTKEAGKFFFTDDLCRKTKLSFYISITGTVIGFLLILYSLLVGVPSREGIMENYSSLLFLFSAIILLFSITRTNRINDLPGMRKKTILFLIVISVILLIIYGEEVSWGQRIFSWDSTGIFKEYNLQNETNIHNFFNPLFKYIYPVVGMCSFIVLFFIWFFPKERKTYLFALLIPHPSLFFLVFIMACASLYGPSEIYEQLLAVFIFLYSFRIFMCLSFPNPARDILTVTFGNTDEQG